MKLSFDEIVELIHREMYVRNGVMLGEKAAAKAILQAEEAAQHRVQSDLGWTCEVCQSTNLESDLECGYCYTPRPTTANANRSAALARKEVMDKVVYCSECHIMFFDVSAKTCHICREGTLLDITHPIKNAAQQGAKTACDHTCKNCGRPMELVCLSSCGT